METLSAAERILATIRAIPRGEVAGYGHVARIAARMRSAADSVSIAD